ncbi:hypothetical protein, partial [Phyllobacterium sp. YR531]|uniref:hypothetical protein n=1 Tax=Phyllobacterium sp. YR531 TaxID=1144343 RepID=UPI001AEBB7F5
FKLALSHNRRSLVITTGLEAGTMFVVRRDSEPSVSTVTRPAKHDRSGLGLSWVMLVHMGTHERRTSSRQNRRAPYALSRARGALYRNWSG